jgi:Fe-S cluster biogenesis protein NfuA/nitrite reductase/ring-hydroxylating ferredoxin subunit
MAQGRDLREVGERVEGLLADLRARADPATLEQAEEAVRLVVELYGAALERAVELLAAAPDGAATVARLADDPLLGSLLVVHGLHPLGLTERVQRALAQVRPYLGSHAGGVELLGVDDAGVARLRLQGSCDGCPSSAVTVRLAIERAVAEAAPELAGIEVEGMAAAPAHGGPQLLQIQPLHRAGDWAPLEGLAGLRPGELRAADAAGTPVVVGAVAGSLYAYRNACAACGSTLDAGTLAGAQLACPACGRRFDLRAAGRGVDDAALHLDPLPLLTEDGATRVAVPQRVAG